MFPIGIEVSEFVENLVCSFCPYEGSRVVVVVLEKVVDDLGELTKWIGATPRAGSDERDEAHAPTAARKAGFATGIQMSFSARGGRRQRGIIVKMNPKRARVECAEGVFHLPYGLLTREDGSCS